MSTKVILNLNPADTGLASGSILSGGVTFERQSPSWGLNGAQQAGAAVPHREKVDGINTVFVGRKTRNMLDPSFAPFSSVPKAWDSIAGLRLEKTDRAFGAGSICVDASSGPVRLGLPAVPVNPQDEAPLKGTAEIGVLVQLSAWVKGSGKVTLSIKDARHNVSCQKSFSLTESWQRPCVALDGVFEPRTIEACITVENGTALIDGLMLEPYVVTHRTVGRALMAPSAGAWVPGGQKRDRDRLALPIAKGAVPRSGMIEFWFRPTWSCLHPSHAFFQMSHWYLDFQMDSGGPKFWAGRKPCEWHYYWEWSVAQGYGADTWHHFATVWDETGTATIYLDGQSRAVCQQIPLNALNPDWVGQTLVIGGTVDDFMCLDHNAPGQLDGYLASWRMHGGRIAPADVLVAMETTDPRPRSVLPPAAATFLVENDRSMIDRQKEHCWFVHNLFKKGNILYALVGRGDDTGHHENRRSAQSERPSYMASRDGGRTWQLCPELHDSAKQRAQLSGGPSLVCSFLSTGSPPCFDMSIQHADGRSEPFKAQIDMSALPEWVPGTTLIHSQTIKLRDGSYLGFFFASLPPVTERTSLIILKSEDGRRWRAVCSPYRPDETATGEGYNEPSGVQLPSGRVLIVMRTGGFGQRLAKGFSDDGGLTWSPVAPSGLCGVNPRLRQMSDGTIVLVTGRPGIILAVSADGGETFEQIACGEDDRIHEMVAEFGWYGYSSMNNGLVIDEPASKAYLGYDILGDRNPGDGTSMNAVYIRPYDIRRFPSYAKNVAAVLPPESPALSRTGAWQVVPGAVAVTTETGATIEGAFEGKALVALLETSTHDGNARVQIDDGPAKIVRLYLPYRRIQRKLLAEGLAPGRHRFRLTLEAGIDPQHKFANPEMPMSAVQTVHLAGVDATRRLAVYGFEVL